MIKTCIFSKYFYKKKLSRQLNNESDKITAIKNLKNN